MKQRRFTPSHSRGFAPILILLVVVLLIGGAYYFGTIKKSSVQIVSTSPSPVAQTTPTSAPIVDETANWKTYTTRKRDFSFKYPNYLNLDTSSDNTFIGLYPSTIDTSKCVEACYDFDVTVKDNSKGSDLKQYYKEVIEDNLNYGEPAIENMTIDNHPAIKFTNIKSISGGSSMISISYSDRIIEISDWDTEMDQVLNRIVSTFKFTQ